MRRWRYPNLAPSSACRPQRLEETAAIHMSAELEAVAVALLESTDGRLRLTAAKVLREKGQATAQAPLWHRLERWSALWRDRVTESTDMPGHHDPNAEEKQFEWALIRALAQASGWVLDRPGLERLLGLCVTRDHCRQVEYMLRGIGEAGEIPITVFAFARASYRVGHYPVESTEALAQRLGHYARGTVFSLSLGARARDEAATAFVARIEAVLSGLGMGLRLR